MKKILLFATFLCLLIPTPAAAHVLLQDSNAKMGAVLHITPNDDPAAGELSSLAFDVQDQKVTDDNYSFTLQISGPQETTEVIPITAQGTVIAASYIFPTTGLYTIKLQAEPMDTSRPTLGFAHSQQISRGAMAENPPNHLLAEAGLVASIGTLLVLGVLFWNNRSEMRLLVNKK